MSNTNGSTTLSKSMNGLIDINDGAGTDISNGNITCNSLTTKTFQTDTFTATTLTDGVCQITNGNITGVNTIACNTFQCSTFSAANLSGNLVESVTSQSQTFNIVDTASYTLGLFLNMASFFTSYISTLDLTNGWKWFNGPTLSTCMILDTAGNLQTNSLQPLNTSSIFNILTNQITGAIINIGSALSTTNFLGTIKANTISPISTGVTVNTFTFGANNVVTNSNNQTNVNLFIDNIAPVNIGGPGSVYLARQGSYYVEAGSQNYATVSSYLNFHSINVPNYYDSQIIATGGSSTSYGEGTLSLLAGTINLTPTTALNATTKTITLTGSTTAGKINLVAPTIQLNTNTFRYIPWTLINTGITGTSASLTNVLNYPTGANAATCSTGATIRYRYSVVGNMLYLNYYFYQVSTGTTGNGTYQYAFPSLVGLGFVIDNTQLIAFSTGGTTPYGGTRMGSASFLVYGSYTSIGGVYYSTLNGQGLTLWNEVGNASGGVQSSALYNYYGAYSSYQFEAMIPII